MSEKCHNNKIINKHNNNNSDNPLTSRRTDGGKNETTSRRTEGVIASNLEIIMTMTIVTVIKLTGRKKDRQKGID